MSKEQNKKALEQAIIHKKHTTMTIGKQSLNQYKEESGYLGTAISNLVEEKAMSDLRKIEDGLALMEEYKKLGVTNFDSKMLWLLSIKNDT